MVTFLITKRGFNYFEKDIAAIITGKTGLYAAIRSSFQHYLFSTAPFAKIIKREKDLEIADSLIKSYNRELISAQTQFDTAFNAKKTGQVLEAVINTENDNFQYKSLPMQIIEDMVTLDYG